MRPIILPSILVMPFLLTKTCWGEDKSNQKNSAELFQGEWVLVSIGYADYEVRGTAEKPMKVTFSKGQMVTRPAYNLNSSTSMSFGRGGVNTERTIAIRLTDRAQEATFRLDPTKEPGQIDLEEKDGKKTQVRKGIYRLTKDDLELCIGSSSRPQEFKPSASVILLRLKRTQKIDR